MEGDFGFDEHALDILGMSGQGVVNVAVGGGTTAALAVVTRIAAPVGSGLHRHAPAVAGLVGAVVAGLTTKSVAGVLSAVIVGGGMWLGERVLEYQAGRLLPAGT